MECVRQYENQPKALKRTRKMCEDCQARNPSFGLASEQKRRWCYGCALPRASRHEAVVSLKTAHGQPSGRPIVKPCSIPMYIPAGWLVHYRCSSVLESAQEIKATAVPIRPVAGPRTGPKTTQAATAAVAVLSTGDKTTRQRICEDCHLKHASHGLDNERKRRWCATCAKIHHEAVLLKKRKLCEDCQQRDPSFGLASDRKRRWCWKCAQHHDQSTKLKRSGKARRNANKSIDLPQAGGAVLGLSMPTREAQKPAAGPRPPGEPPPPRTGCIIPPASLAGPREGHGQATLRPAWPSLPPMLPLTAAMNG